MENILIMDTSVASLNKGDDIIMKCIEHELRGLTDNRFTLTLPTHVSPFQWYQVLRNSNRLQIYSNAKYKFIGGTNLLTMDMLTHFPQWNINLLNYSPLKESILVGVGAGKGNKMNFYTKTLYRKVLSKKYIHSVRDERTKQFLEEMGLQAINTGCATLWSLTPEFCNQIPKKKASSVIFTLTHHNPDIENDQLLINTLNSNYENIYFWIQDGDDYEYFKSLKNIGNIQIVPPRLKAYENILQKDLDFVGTRLHGGIFAMRNKKRTIIISIDERAKGMSETYNLNTIERLDMKDLDRVINSDIITNVNVDFEKINKWMNQFELATI